MFMISITILPFLRMDIRFLELLCFSLILETKLPHVLFLRVLHVPHQVALV